MQPLLTAFMLFGVKPYIIALANITFPNTQENTFGIIVGGKKTIGSKRGLTCPTAKVVQAGRKRKFIFSFLRHSLPLSALAESNKKNRRRFCAATGRVSAVYSTVTDFARLRGWSTSQSLTTAM